MRGVASNPGETPLADSETCPVGWMDTHWQAVTVQESSVTVVWALMTGSPGPGMSSLWVSRLAPTAFQVC